MARQNINLGTAPGGLDGDDARTAFTKTNANFTELYGGTVLQPLNAKLTAISASVWAANQLMYTTGTGTVAMTALTAFARTLLDDADADAARTTLKAVGIGQFGVGSSAAPLLDDFAASNAGGLYHAFTSGHPSATPGGPSGVPAGAFSVMHMGGLNTSYQAVLAAQNGSTAPGTRIFVGSRASATALYWNELVRRGDFGIGSYCERKTPAEINAALLDSGMYEVQPQTPAAWPDSPFPNGWTRMLHLRHNNPTGYWSQIALDFNFRPRMKLRGMSAGTIGEWVEVYSQISAVGTVGQAGGVPTGAIIEHGANSNGRYTKLADGTLVQWGQIILAENVAVGTANSGGGYRSAELQITFPVGFAPRNAAQDQPICTDVYIQNNSAGVRAHPAQDSGIFGGSFVLETKGSSTTVTAGLYIRWKAIGRWY